jgi:hypothetical protein
VIECEETEECSPSSKKTEKTRRKESTTERNKETKPKRSESSKTEGDAVLPVSLSQGKVLTFSHFLPRRDLLPWLSTLMKRSLSLVTGYSPLDQQLRSAHSRVHLFGHSHLNCDTHKQGVRYVQNALGHPTERRSWWKKSTYKLLLIEL